VQVAAVPKARWSAVCRDCAGAIDSIVELLQGQFSDGVMARICHERTALFPSPAEITFTCSCPDWASMCKHVAAVLYGIGARLDEQPDLLFALRKVDQQDLIARAGKGLAQSGKGPKAGKVLDTADLSEMFGIEMAKAAKPRATAVRKKPAARSYVGSGFSRTSTEPVTPLNATPAAPTPAKSAATSAARSSVSTRMKEYWRDRRRRQDKTPR
jgi:uncharacterized Zn finger protein